MSHPPTNPQKLPKSDRSRSRRDKRQRDDAKTKAPSPLPNPTKRRRSSQTRENPAKRSRSDRKETAVVVNGEPALPSFESGVFVIGVDEVGRGPLAGPVVAGAVHLLSESVAKELRSMGVRDSKRMSASKRTAAAKFLQSSDNTQGELRAVVATSWVDERQIDSTDNILTSTLEAMTYAVRQVQSKLCAIMPTARFVVRVDGKDVPEELLKDESIVSATAVKKGDDLELCISAASVVAKVARDAFMHQQHTKYPQYGFNTNVGYGTPKHLAALAQHGPSPIHRRSFAPLRSTHFKSGQPR